MTRAVHQTNLKSGRTQDAGPEPFSDFTAFPNLVLLGDPGTGKTHVFTEAAKAEGGRFIKARAFLSMPAGLLSGQALFIDGLDEQRGGRSDRAIIDELVAKLFEVGPAKVRISCRVADWLGDSDLAGLQPYFDQHGETAVLLLQRLSRSEQLAVLNATDAGAADAEAFLDEAQERGLDDFLENPQNLLMLWRAVRAGNWPQTRKALFDVSAGLLLKEFNEERARAGSGSIAAAELRPVAGAVCAARLISDVAAISLKDQEGTADIPGYRSVMFFPPDAVQAALGRRIFDAGQDPETVDYSHRTIAEFVAAEFLAARVRAGLPFGRVRALMGVDGHPAAELRGLHAWLAVHLPERADELIEADPYGVLTYGDAAALSPSSCACLLRALARLASENPWFRSGKWEARAISGLSRKDMVAEFRAILNDPGLGFGIRSVVVDALMLGNVILEMVPDLAAVLARQASPFSERAHALAALLRYGADGENAVRQVFGHLGKTVNDIRLRAEVIRVLYGRPYGAPDVVTLLNDSMLGEDAGGTGMFWRLADIIPAANIPAVLDGMTPPRADNKGFDRRGWEAGSFYARLLVRVWRETAEADPERIMRWLRKRIAFKGGTSESRARDLRAAIRETPERLASLARHFFRTVSVDKDQWLSWHRFREALLHEMSADALLGVAQAEMLTTTESDRRDFIYHIAFSLCYQAIHPQADVAFEQLFALPGTDAALAAIRDQATVSNLPPNYFTGRVSRPEINMDETREKQRQDFDRDVAQIRSGLHMGWLLHLMRFYFAFYDDVDRAASPRVRVTAWVGENRINAALEGLAASLSRADIPSLADVLASAAERKHFDWWYALSAGLNERLGAGQGFAGLSDDFLKDMLVFDVANPLSEHRGGAEDWVVQPWRKELMEPDLVRDAYLAVARLHLSSTSGRTSDGLSELLSEAIFAPHRADIVLDLLQAHPNAYQYDLAKLLGAAVKLPSLHDTLVALCRTVLGSGTLDRPKHDLWLVTAYGLSPSEFESDIEARTAAHPEFVFELRDHLNVERDDKSVSIRPLQETEFLARLVGSLFPYTPYPSDTWEGDTNAWDAADWVRALVDTISASPTEAATEALERLKDNTSLASYLPNILHALANQRQRRRDAEYDRPIGPEPSPLWTMGPQQPSPIFMRYWLRSFLTRSSASHGPIRIFSSNSGISTRIHARPSHGPKKPAVTTLSI